MTRTIAFQNVRIFDGSRVLPQGTVIVQDDTITAVGNDVALPSDAQVIDGTGHTLLPGLIDSHTHAFGPALKQALVFGVTTELDMFTDHNFAREIKQQQAEGQGLDMADLRSCGTLVTAPGGHGTEYGLRIPTITEPGEAQDFVDARIAEGSDYIKIIYDDGKAFGRPIPSINKATMAAVIEAAHKRGKLAIIHVLTLQHARDAIEAGADALAHLFIDKAPDAEFGRFVAAHHAFVVPTLTVLESATGSPSGTSLVTDTHLAPYLSKEDVRGLQSSFSFLPANAPTRSYAAAEETVRQSKAAGVTILAGTDAPNPGTTHGASIHRELELLVQAGLTPGEALAAATSLPAAMFGLTDRGRIAPGLRADLLLIDGDPTTDIKATRNIVGIWKRGVPVDRQAYRAAIEQQRAESLNRPAPVGSESDLVSDFEDGTLSTKFGSGWSISTDSFRGGSSTAEFKVVPDGAHGSRGSLFITGEIVPGPWFPMAGAMFYPGPAPWTPANLSSKKGLSFWAKGDGQMYRVVIFSGSLMSRPPTVTFTAGPEWQQFSFPFSQFDDIDGHDLLGILFTAGPAAGRFAFQIDDVRFLN